MEILFALARRERRRERVSLILGWIVLCHGEDPPWRVVIVLICENESGYILDGYCYVAQL